MMTVLDGGFLTVRRKSAMAWVASRTIVEGEIAGDKPAPA